MDDKPTVPETPKPDYDDVAAFGLSLRGYITSLLVVTVCIQSGLGVPVSQPVLTMALVCLGFYFGKGNGSNGNNGTNRT